LAIKFVNNVNKVIANIENKKKLALEEIGKNVEKRAVLLVPVLSGDLRKSISFKIDKDSVSIGVLKGSAGEKYATIIEIGDIKRKPQPYLKPAFKAAENEIKQILKNKLK